MRVRHLLAAALLAVTGACAATDDEATGTDPAAPPSPTSAPTPAVVPALTGLEPATAEARLRAAGLRPRRTSDVHQDCGPGTAVTATSPPAGAPPARRGVVVLVVPDPRTTCDVSPELREVGAAFVDFARGQGPPPRLAAPVPLLLGNRRFATITAESADDPAAWAVCPPGAVGVFGYSCPVSALGLVRDNEVNGYADDLRAERSPGPCDGTSAPRVPAGLDHLELLVVGVLPEQSSCAYGGRTELYLDADGRVAAVDVVPSEP